MFLTYLTEILVCEFQFAFLILELAVIMLVNSIHLFGHKWKANEKFSELKKLLYTI